MRLTYSLTFYFFIFFFFLKSDFAFAQQGCVMIIEDVNAVDVEHGSSTPFTAGRILPFTEYDTLNKRFKSLYRGKEYWIPDSHTKFGPVSLCSVEPRCFKVEKSASIYEQRHLKAPRVSIAIKGQRLPLMGKAKLGNLTWAQVEVGDKFGWMLASMGMIENKACPKTDLAQKTHFTFVFEIGYERGLKNTNYDSLLSTVRDPSDVEYTLPNPFHTHVNPGSGYFMNALLGLDLREVYRLEFGIGYGTYSFPLVTYNNPSNFPDESGVPFSSLVPTDIMISENYFLFPLGAYYKINSLSRWSYRMGLRLDLLYYLGKVYTSSYFTGNLFKQTAGSLSAGPEVIQHKESLDFRLLYRINTQNEIGLSYKYSTLNSHSLSLLYEY